MENLSIYFATLASLLLLAVFFAAFWFSRKQTVSYENLARTSSFHCVKCDSVYTAKVDVEIAICPKCGHKNSKLKF